MKKIITYTLVAEMEVDTSWYDEDSDKAIKETELKLARDWAFENIKSEKIIIKKA